jgi:hypothetical protein
MTIKFEISADSAVELRKVLSDLAWQLSITGPVAGGSLGVRPLIEKPVDHPATQPSEIQDKPREKGPVPDEKPTVPPVEPQGSAWDTVTAAVTSETPAPRPAPTGSGEALATAHEASSDALKAKLQELAAKARAAGELVGTAGLKAVLAPYGALLKWPHSELGRLEAQLNAVLTGGQS